MTKLPNFLIVGAAKSGTTSLYEYLRTHPQIFMPARKEPSHFEPKAGGIKSWDEYCRLFDGADQFKRVGEASVSYLMSPAAPERIERALGKDIDIVVLLRNPIDMAYSNWSHQVREGFESLEFLAALHDEERRLSDPAYAQTVGRWLCDMTYSSRAQYSAQVMRYIERFGRERVHVYVFEEFFKPGLPLYSKLLKTLDVDPGHRPVEAAYNKAGFVRSVFARRVLSERMAWKEVLKRAIPPATRARMMGALARINRVDQKLAPMPPEARRYLRIKLLSDVEALSGLLGRNFKTIWGFDG
jgi:hypothetical protein